MGDFEDTFGAGADAVDIIDGYSREYVRSSRSEQLNWCGKSSRTDSKEQGDNDTWSAAMVAKGYTLGPGFGSYEELSAWDSSNSRSHVRRRIDQCYQIYFTDGEPGVVSENTSVPKDRQPRHSTDNDPPF
jgi:hypothetical protein